jgi:hypothetical protein
MPTNPSPSLGQPAADAPDAVAAETWPAPAPAPIAGTEFDQDDTWMTFGLGVDGEEEDRMVTVVFSRPVEDEAATDEFAAEPFAPIFPGAKRRR